MVFIPYKQRSQEALDKALEMNSKKSNIEKIIELDESFKKDNIKMEELIRSNKKDEADHLHKDMIEKQKIHQKLVEEIEKDIC